MDDPIWKLQDAKQRFSELIRAAETDGPQVVSRHGKEVAIVVDIDAYRRLRGPEPKEPSLKDFLLSGPSLDGLDLERSGDLTQAVDLE